MSRTGCRRSPRRPAPGSSRSRRQDPCPLRTRQALGGIASTRHRRDTVTSPVPDRPRFALRLSPSALVLVVVNLVPLAGGLFLVWGVLSTLLLFCGVGVVFGAVNVV